MDRRYVGGDVDLTNPVSLRSGMTRKCHVPFWRAVALVRESLTLIINAAKNILKLAVGHPVSSKACRATEGIPGVGKKPALSR
ncbi:MAG: hypothetical protein F6K65_23515 [Moorea sp. SIO3C2]|nr:hypothetical protein [Moorena sp. SIO3C2]